MGERPVALGHHRFEWLHAAAFVQPTTGGAVWFLSTGLNKPFFEALLAAFARQTGAGRDRHVVLVLENAAWHGPEGLAVPDGVTLVFLPPYSPELQPAERLRPLVDEPVANRHFATLADHDAVVAERCRSLQRRRHPPAHRFPLVARAHPADLITRISYERVGASLGFRERRSSRSLLFGPKPYRTYPCRWRGERAVPVRGTPAPAANRERSL